MPPIRKKLPKLLPKPSATSSSAEPTPLKPFWQTTDGQLVRLYQGHTLSVLQQLPARSVQCVVTSPPYWGLRDYGAGQQVQWIDGWFGAYGSEPTPDMFVLHTVEIFREVRRVMRDDATLFLNLGDSYTSGGNLVGIPWRVALALQADGWVLRQDIIWHKPSPMPESVRNRCTKAHEYVFLLTKSNKYYCDMEAIKERATPGTTITREKSLSNRQAVGVGANPSGNAKPGTEWSWGNTSNKRSVWKIEEEELEQFRQWKHLQETQRLDTWTIASSGYPGAHFATFPPKLIEPMIKAGTSEVGCCVKCQTPWFRVTKEKNLTRERPNDYVKRTGEEGTGNSCSNSVAGVEVETVGWKPGCNCREEDVIPCTVLDPFIGSGTTCAVSIALGRRSIGIDLSEAYLAKNAVPRVEGVLLSRPALAHLAGKKRVPMSAGLRKV